jgi:hypothetical protein
LRWQRRIHAHPLRRQVKTAANKYERKNDHPWGLHNNLLILNCPKKKIRQGAGPHLKYFLLAPRFRTNADK